MELIAAVLLAGPIGFLVADRRIALLVYLGCWLAILPVQTLSVADDDLNWQYGVANALVLGLGIALNRTGNVLGHRRRQRMAQ